MSEVPVGGGLRVGGKHARGGTVNSFWHVENVGGGREWRVFENCVPVKSFTVPPIACFPPLPCHFPQASATSTPNLPHPTRLRHAGSLHTPLPVSMPHVDWEVRIQLAWHSPAASPTCELASSPPHASRHASRMQHPTPISRASPIPHWPMRISSVFLACPASNSQEGLRHIPIRKKA
jgi:hypothetical protein